jgi:response regulator RpfG family c-di-GMP phosphodiesterase
VFGLVDSYEAIVRDDVGYRARRDHDAARDEIIELAGVRYDPELVAIFSRIDKQAWRAVEGGVILRVA